MTISSSSHNNQPSSKSQEEEMRLLERETTKECEEIIQNKIISCQAIQVYQIEILIFNDIKSQKYINHLLLSHLISPTIIYIYFMSLFNFFLVSIISFTISKSNKNFYQIFIHKSC